MTASAMKPVTSCKTFAAALQATARRDQSARLGGDEFCVVEGAPQARKHGFGACGAFAGAAGDGLSGRAFSCEVSHGSAHFTRIADDSRRLRDADRALYRSKSRRLPLE